MGSCSGLIVVKSSPSTNQIARNMSKDEELELLHFITFSAVIYWDLLHFQQWFTEIYYIFSSDLLRFITFSAVIYWDLLHFQQRFTEIYYIFSSDLLRFISEL